MMDLFSVLLRPILHQHLIHSGQFSLITDISQSVMIPSSGHIFTRNVKSLAFDCSPPTYPPSSKPSSRTECDYVIHTRFSARINKRKTTIFSGKTYLSCRCWNKEEKSLPITILLHNIAVSAESARRNMPHICQYCQRDQLHRRPDTMSISSSKISTFSGSCFLLIIWTCLPFS